MSRLPIPGSDPGTWGTILNDYLSQSLNADGSLKSSATSAAGAELTTNKGQASGYAPLDSSAKVPSVNLPTATAPPDASATTKGLIQLAGDLAGSAASPTVPGLAGKVDTTRTVNGHALSSDVTITKSDVGLGSVVNADTTTTANISDSSNKRFVTDAELAVLSTTSGTNTGDQDLSGLVPKTTTVNGHALSTNVTVTASDVGALGATAAAGGDLTGTYPNPTVTSTANFKTQVETVRLDQMAAPTASVSLNTQKITGLANGTASTDAAAFGQIPTSASSIGGMTTATYDPASINQQVLGTTATQTVSNKRVTKRVATLTDAATVTPDSDNFDGGKLTSLSQTTAIANPTGTPTSFQQYTLRIKSTSSQTLSFGTQYRGSNTVALPTVTTGGGKTDYLGFQWNADDSKWDLLALSLGY